jgi:pilus assembly protein Flp/PilA
MPGNTAFADLIVHVFDHVLFDRRVLRHRFPVHSPRGCTRQNGSVAAVATKQGTDRILDNGKPSVKKGRKAKGPPDRFRGTAWLPKGDHTMKKLVQFAVDFLKRDDGPTAVEYAVMLALIIVVCIGAITTLGSNANKTFNSVGQAVQIAAS